LVLDAFSSDAIPMHLITREAVALYRERLTDDGLIAIHISNRHLALGPVIARLAADASTVVRERVDPSDPRLIADGVRTASHLVVMAPAERNLGTIARDTRWKTGTVGADTPLFTDDFSNVLGTLR